MALDRNVICVVLSLFIFPYYPLSLAGDMKKTGCKFQERFVIDQKKYFFCQDSRTEMLIDQKCHWSVDTCGVYMAILKLEGLNIKGRNGGINPGALLCRRIHGMVVTGTDMQGNENSFCRFPDGSMISNDSLVGLARSNQFRKF